MTDKNTEVLANSGRDQSDEQSFNVAEHAWFMLLSAFYNNPLVGRDVCSADRKQDFLLQRVLTLGGTRQFRKVSTSISFWAGDEKTLPADNTVGIFADDCNSLVFGLSDKAYDATTNGIAVVQKAIDKGEFKDIKMVFLTCNDAEQAKTFIDVFVDAFLQNKKLLRDDVRFVVLTTV